MDRVSGFFDPENVSSNFSKCLFKTDFLEMSNNQRIIRMFVLTIPIEFLLTELFAFKNIPLSNSAGFCAKTLPSELFAFKKYSAVQFSGFLR